MFDSHSTADPANHPEGSDFGFSPLHSIYNLPWRILSVIELSERQTLPELRSGPLTGIFSIRFLQERGLGSLTLRPPNYCWLFHSWKFNLKQHVPDFNPRLGQSTKRSPRLD